MGIAKRRIVAAAVIAPAPVARVAAPVATAVVVKTGMNRRQGRR